MEYRLKIKAGGVVALIPVFIYPAQGRRGRGQMVVRAAKFFFREKRVQIRTGGCLHGFRVISSLVPRFRSDHAGDTCLPRTQSSSGGVWEGRAGSAYETSCRLRHTAALVIKSFDASDSGHGLPVITFFLCSEKSNCAGADKGLRHAHTHARKRKRRHKPTHTVTHRHTPTRACAGHDACGDA